MTIKEMIKELEEIAKIVGEDANVVNAEDDDVYSICESVREKEIVIYF